MPAMPLLRTDCYSNRCLLGGQSGGMAYARLSRFELDPFRLEGGNMLFGHALFEALSAEMTAKGYGAMSAKASSKR